MKQNQNISLRLVAFTDAAGKYSPEAFRGGNEDNFFVSDDLAEVSAGKPAQDEVFRLGERGILMAVADGMGGMNAGEVASQIAIDTVKAAFSPGALSDSIVSSEQSRRRYLEEVIRRADKNIKSAAMKDRSREGMGSTVILAWLFQNELTISWVGDSRAYIFNEKSGIRLISRDHSYVQELVNKGLLTYDQTFDHPQNNIITRSLGDPSKEAKPESKTLSVGRGDIILLCSDGLSGVLRDRKTYTAAGELLADENLEDIICAHTGSMKECREALWLAAERAGWYDNVTAILCQITDGPESTWANTDSDPLPPRKKKRGLLYCCGAILAVGAIAAASFWLGRYSGQGDGHTCVDTIGQANTDTIPPEPVVTPEPAEPAAKPETKPENEPRKAPTIQERIEEQAQEAIVDSVAQKAKELTEIKRHLTPKEDKNKNHQKADIPPMPANPETDNSSENPIINQ